MKKTFQFVIHMLKLLKKDHPALRYVLLIGPLCNGMLPFYTLYFSSQILNQLYAGAIEQAKAFVIYLISGAVLLGVVGRVCQQVMAVYYDTIDQSYRQQLTDKSFLLSFEKYERKETLAKIEQINANEHRYANRPSGLLKSLFQWLIYFWSAIFSLFYLFQLFILKQNNGLLISILFVIFMIGFILLLNRMNNVDNKKVLEINEVTTQRNAPAMYYAGTALELSIAKEYRIFNMHSLFEKYSDLYHQIFKNDSKRYFKLKSHLNGMNALLLQLFSGISFLYVCFQVIHGILQVGDVLLYTGAISQFSSSVTNLLSEYSLIKHRIHYVNLYHEFINSSDMDYDGTLPIEKRDDNSYHFQFEDVSFKYPGTDQMILNHINLDFNVGESYAIVGQNGAGKSTLIKLLCRLYEPTEGRILLNGIDIKKYNYEEYTEVFSVVFQDFKLYALNLDENIACSENVDEKKVQEVLNQVGIYDHIMEHPDGTQQLLYKETGDGVTVSGGEAQKIAIARALYKDAPFVILDEPTSALDPISEAEIYENFNNMIKDKTAIYISHRMSSCRFCDHIVVLDQGEVEEYGDHETLMKQNGLYSELWNAQAQYYQKEETSQG